MNRSSGRQLLIWVLRFDAAALSVAWLAIFLSRDFMNQSNDLLGLDPLPATPIVDYLTRSLAVMYASRGLFVWLASLDVERYRPLVLLIGWSNVLLGAMLFGIDLYAGMPWWWKLGEGPGVILIGLVIVGLCMRFVEEPSR